MLSLYYSMRTSIVLLKCEYWYIIIMERINKQKKIFVKKLNICILLDAIVNEDKKTKFIANEASSNHLWHIVIPYLTMNIHHYTFLFFSLLSPNI